MAKGAMLRILIADDHAVIRQGLRDILREADIAAVVVEAHDGTEAVEKGLAEAWDIVVLDIRMPGLNGLDVLKQLKQARPDLCVVMLSMHVDVQYIRGALAAGAAAYLTKEMAPDELVSAIQAVLTGQTYLGDDLAKLL